MKFIIHILVLTSVQIFASEKLSVPRVIVPSITVDEISVPYVLVTRSCIRQTTFWEKLNNGLDGTTQCNDLKFLPTDNVYYGHVVQANKNGEFEIPEHTITYSNKRFKEEVSCYKIVPVSGIRDIWNGDKSPDMIQTVESLRYCSKEPLPDWMNTRESDRIFHIKEYSSTLTKGVHFKSKN